MDNAYIKKIDDLKTAILRYLRLNGRHYGDMTRQEQHVEDLAQALNTSLDQLKYNLENGGQDRPEPTTPRETLASRMLDTALRLSKGGKVDQEMADDFDGVLDALDLAADLKRRAESVKDTAESTAIKYKRGRS